MAPGLFNTILWVLLKIAGVWQNYGFISCLLQLVSGTVATHQAWKFGCGEVEKGGFVKESDFLELLHAVKFWNTIQGIVLVFNDDLWNTTRI